MQTSIGIYLLIGIPFAIVVWAYRNKSEIPYLYASAAAAFLMWPAFAGLILGQYIKEWYYHRKKDGQPK